MLWSPLNVSEGRDHARLARLRSAAGEALLDVHSDADHNRSVFTLGGDAVSEAARAVTAEAVNSLDLRAHRGVHPRLGVVDVVPFVPLVGRDLTAALVARDRYAQWAAGELSLPVFLFGPERSLPEIRRGAFGPMSPSVGPGEAHPTAGAVCAGARAPLLAWNVWLQTGELHIAVEIAAELRRTLPHVRSLGLRLGATTQVSCNLVEPHETGPDAVYDFVRARTPVARCELVGLAPAAVLDRIDPARWPDLDLSTEKTLESRLGG